MKKERKSKDFETWFNQCYDLGEGGTKNPGSTIEFLRSKEGLTYDSVECPLSCMDPFLKLALSMIYIYMHT